MEHRFDVELANKYGLSAAVVLHYIGYWVIHNKYNEKNYHKGYYWTYNSFDVFRKYLPYFTVRQIRTILENLQIKKVIKVGRFKKNKSGGYPNCYTIINKEVLKIFEVPQMQNKDLSELTNPSQKNKDLSELTSGELSELTDDPRGDLSELTDRTCQNGQIFYNINKQDINKLDINKPMPDKSGGSSSSKKNSKKSLPKETVLFKKEKPYFINLGTSLKTIEGFFYHFNDNLFAEASRQVHSIKNILKRVKKYWPDSNEDEIDLIAPYIYKFHELKFKSKIKFWNDKAFLPSSLDSLGNWDLLHEIVKKEYEEKQKALALKKKKEESRKKKKQKDEELRKAVEAGHRKDIPSFGEYLKNQKKKTG